jgi:hypothetical protein
MPAPKQPEDNAAECTDQDCEVGKHQGQAKRPEQGPEASQTEEPYEAGLHRTGPGPSAGVAPEERSKNDCCNREQDGFDVHDPGKIEGHTEPGQEVEGRGTGDDENPAPSGAAP